MYVAHMEREHRTHHLTITVAALTRGRPQMLERLILSWGQMDVPDNATVRCLIVENDDTALSEQIVLKHKLLANGLALDYVLETELGIPFGRNRAAKEAIAAGHDLLAFVDDDEYVAQDWLVRLLDGYRNSHAVLLGAPLRCAPAQDGLTSMQRLMHRNIKQRYDQKEARAAKLASLNETPRVTVVTNNWLAETRLFDKDGIWFDENMRFTGGTDSKLCAEVKAAGFKVGWVADAHVYEIIPEDRLSFGYQFARARDQSNTHFARRIERQPFARYSVILRVPIKLIEITVLTIALPLTKGRTLLKIARSSGWLVGRIGASFGRQSSLYRTTTGS